MILFQWEEEVQGPFLPVLHGSAAHKSFNLINLIFFPKQATDDASKYTQFERKTKVK